MFLSISSAPLPGLSSHGGLMDGFWLPLLLSLHVVVISSAYNVEVLDHRRFSTRGNSLFGYKVVQFNSSHGKRVLIGDPGANVLQACEVLSAECTNISLPDQNTTSHLGLTLEVDPLSSRCLVCGTERPHNCGNTEYTNGACYTVHPNLTASEKSLPGYHECQKVEVDLCFLFDNSDSVGPTEFQTVKNFLIKTIQNLKNSTLNFAVVQFSSQFRTVFNFEAYKRGEAEKLILNMTQISGTTKTYQAINFTLKNIFTPNAGIREQAKKILLILTDGEAIDDNRGVTEAADKQNVTRYILGVGKNFRYEYITTMASNPAINHSRVLTNYSELGGFFTELQTKILAIEGLAQGSTFTREMSLAGLSAALTQDRVILGDPGIFSWSGGILDVPGQEELVYKSPEEENYYRYLGYAVELLHNEMGLFSVVGSPRYQYVGCVTVLKEVPGERRWEEIDFVLGKQIGSYYGAEIAVSDLDQDGVSDLVLIGAPYHYEPKWSGQVFVCQFNKTLDCMVILHGDPGHLESQFGAVVSSLGDLDGDGFTEVAVGAPYEMDGQGALYIYKGDSQGLSSVYSQRLLSPPGILGFGLSVHGILDMTGDGLIDVVVGSQGHVTLHRSKPLLHVNMSVTSIQKYMVVSSPEDSTCDKKLTLMVCALAQILTLEFTGSLSTSIQYHLILDSYKTESRMFFTNGGREMNGTTVIRRPGLQCQNSTIFLQDCNLEDVSGVQVSLTASLEPVDSLWLLSPSSYLNASDLISFQMCEEGVNCEPNMSVQLTHSHLVIKDGASFSMFLSLHNMSMKAHQTRLRVVVPAGLSFRKANVSEASHWISLVCGDFTEQTLGCNVSHPLLKRGVRAVIQIMFSVVSNVSWAERIFLAVNVTSESDGNTTLFSAEDEVPVLYPLQVISRSLEDSTKYVPFTNHDEEETAVHRYQIQNLGSNPVSINLSVSVSSLLEGVSWHYNISLSPQDSGIICSNDNGSIVPSVNQTWGCSINGSGDMSIIVAGRLKPTQMWKVQRSLSVRSAVKIRYDERQYHSDAGSVFHEAQVVTQVQLLLSPDYLPYIAGGSGGGVLMLILISYLLYKCGFFKSYKDRMMEDDQSAGCKQDALHGPQEPLTSGST